MNQCVHPPTHPHPPDHNPQILESQSLETATILQFNGLWFRNNADGTPNDDSIP